MGHVGRFLCRILPAIEFLPSSERVKVRGTGLKYLQQTPKQCRPTVEEQYQDVDLPLPILNRSTACFLRNLNGHTVSQPSMWGMTTQPATYLDKHVA